MPTFARSQQRYDDPPRNLVQRTGDVTVATHLGVPRTDLQRLKRDTESGRQVASAAASVATAAQPTTQPSQTSSSAVIATAKQHRFGVAAGVRAMLILLGDKFGGFGGTLGIRCSSLASPWAVAIRHLRYCKDCLCITFRSLLTGRRRKQAQIVVFDGQSATPRLEVADSAMPVKDKRWRLPAAPSSPDFINGLARADNVVRNSHGSVTVAIAVDQ